MKTSVSHFPVMTAFNAKRGDLVTVHTVELQECVCMVCVPSDPCTSARVLVNVISCRVQPSEQGFMPNGTLITVHPDSPATILDQIEPLALRARTQDASEMGTREMKAFCGFFQPQQ